MRGPDVDKERSEKPHTLAEFLHLYNENLPDAFPRASVALLEEFRATHAGFFKSGGPWSLELHRKRVMDWMRMRSA